MMKYTDRSNAKHIEGNYVSILEIGLKSGKNGRSKYKSVCNSFNFVWIQPWNEVIDLWSALWISDSSTRLFEMAQEGGKEQCLLFGYITIGQSMT